MRLRFRVKLLYNIMVIITLFTVIITAIMMSSIVSATGLFLSASGFRLHRG